MRQRCPVCGQTLPEGMDAAEIDRQLEKIGAAEADKVRRELTDEYSQQLAKKEAELSNRAKKDAQAPVRDQNASAEGPGIRAQCAEGGR